MTSGADIAEVFYGLPRAPWSTIKHLTDRGVSVYGLTEPDPPKGGRVFPRSRTIFDFAPDEDDRGESALLFLERTSWGEPIDIVAWLSPRRMLSWTGAAALLGQPALCELHLTTQSACPVFRSPLDWLRAERQGVVIVNPEKAAPALLTRPLLAEDHAHRRDLEKLIRPKILVPQKE